MRIFYLITITLLLFAVSITSLIVNFTNDDGDFYNKVYGREDDEYYVLIHGLKNESENNCKWTVLNVQRNFCEDAVEEAKQLENNKEYSMYIFDVSKESYSTDDVFEALNYKTKFEHQTLDNQLASEIKKIESTTEILAKEEEIESFEERIANNNKIISSTSSSESEKEEARNENVELEQIVERIQNELQNIEEYEKLVKLRAEKKEANELWGANLNVNSIGSPILIYVKNSKPVFLTAGRNSVTFMQQLK